MTRLDVSRFVTKCKIAASSNFIFEWTEKNKQTLISLGYTERNVLDEILELSEEDFVEGPLIDLDGYKGEFWVFGRIIQNREIYIKLKVKDLNAEGDKQLTTLCISFHFSEKSLTYLYK